MYERTVKALGSLRAKAVPVLAGAATTLGEMSRDAALRNTDLYDVLKDTFRMYNPTVIPREWGYIAEGVAVGLIIWSSIHTLREYFKDKKELYDAKKE